MGNYLETNWGIVLQLLGELFCNYLGNFVETRHYFATRDLKEGEVREGGRGWNIMKNFVIFWTLLCFVWVIFGTVLAGKEMEHQGDLEQFGTALGATIGIGIIIAIWFFGSFVSLTIGLLIRKSTIVERGPTGALAVSSLPTS